MKKIALLCLALSACMPTRRTTFSRICSVHMQAANAFILLLDDGSGALVPRAVYADDVKIVPDVPVGASLWAEHLDEPGEFRGEGDRLILHVRSLDDVAR